MRMRANTAIGGFLIGLLFTTAVTAAFWTPFDPLRVNLRARLQPPSALYWLGTDEFGRDVLSRIMAGAATSVLVSLLTVTFAVAIGAVVGVVTGTLRGWTDRVIMAANDALLAFPGILLALAVMMVTGANTFGIILALGIAYIPSVVRLVRGTVLSIREKEYIEARSSAIELYMVRSSAQQPRSVAFGNQHVRLGAAGGSALSFSTGAPPPLDLGTAGGKPPYMERRLAQHRAGPVHRPTLWHQPATHPPTGRPADGTDDRTAADGRQSPYRGPRYLRPSPIFRSRSHAANSLAVVGVRSGGRSRHAASRSAPARSAPDRAASCSTAQTSRHFSQALRLAWTDRWHGFSGPMVRQSGHQRRHADGRGPRPAHAMPKRRSNNVASTCWSGFRSVSPPIPSTPIRTTSGGMRQRIAGLRHAAAKGC